MNIESYEKHHSALMEKWRNKHKSIKCGNCNSECGFVIDGIVCPDTWFSLPHNEERIVFLLKEAYTKAEKKYDWNEAKWLAHEKCMDDCIKPCNKCDIPGSTFNPVAEWVHGISMVNRGESSEYDSWLGIKSRKNIDYCIAIDRLLSCSAIVNIKKSDGVSQSDKDDIYYHAALDKGLLIKQIEIIQPTLIICGGTYEMLRCIFPELEKLENPDDGHTKLGKIKVIASCHPNARGNNQAKYDKIISNYIALGKR